jgi:hypothetical protein
MDAIDYHKQMRITISNIAGLGLDFGCRNDGYVNWTTTAILSWKYAGRREGLSIFLPFTESWWLSMVGAMQITTNAKLLLAKEYGMEYLAKVYTLPRRMIVFLNQDEDSNPTRSQMLDRCKSSTRNKENGPEHLSS